MSFQTHDTMNAEQQLSSTEKWILRFAVSIYPISESVYSRRSTGVITHLGYGSSFGKNEDDEEPRLRQVDGRRFEIRYKDGMCVCVCVWIDGY